jgi:diguanylate cyclase (GGDEF)-like protein/PAS domain S-box-containing protein
MRKIASGHIYSGESAHASVLLFVLIFLLIPCVAFPQAPDSTGRKPTLRTVQDIFRLTRTEARTGYPIDLDAVVTYSDPEWGHLFLRDQTASMFIDVRGTSAFYPLGTHVRVKAVTDANDQDVVVIHPKVTVLGQGTPPDAEPKSMAELENGAADSQFVSTTGVLYSCDRNVKRICYRIYSGEKWAWVFIPQPESAYAQSLMGALVQVTGVVGRYSDPVNKHADTALLVYSLQKIKVQEPSQAGGANGRRRALHTVQELLHLSRSESGKEIPVELDAVVTYSDPEWGILFVQDQTGGTYVDVRGKTTKYPPGERVRVEGVSSSGETGPFVAQPKVIALGPGLPTKPQPKSVAELDAGAGIGSWVVTEGVLHPCEKIWSRACFRVFDGKKLVWLIVPQPDSPAAQSLIGATVRVRAVCGNHLDAANTRVAAQLYANTLNDIEVETPPLPFLFSSSIVPVQDLRAQDADERFARQIHVRGTVTWQSPGLFTIQDNSGTLFVGTGKDVVVHTGNTVDAIGFPSHGELGLELADSAVRAFAAQSSTAGIAPRKTTAAEVVKNSLDGSRVHLKAHLISQSTDATEVVYQLQDGDQRFKAVLLRSDASGAAVGLAPDSVLELTGVALLQGANHREGESFLLLIESPSDIVVQGGFGWLTLRRGLFILCGLAFCVIVPFAWGMILRRTVRKQTAVIRARLANELHLESKYRRLFERNLAAVFFWRPDGAIVDCNMAFVKMLGLQSREDLIGRSYWDLEIDPDRRERLKNALEIGESLSNRDACLRRDDGDTVFLLVNITPVHSSRGLVYETTAIDVSQLKQNQVELQRAKDAAVHDSLYDLLTGLPNRRFLSNALSSLLVEAQREASKIALLYMDLSEFKLVNDSLGHPIGDALLAQVAARLRSWIRQGDLLARLGGDEFMVVMHNLHAREEAVQMAEDMLEAIANPFEVKGHVLAIGASIGISIFPDDAADAEELIQQADSAMYVAKREGRNRAMCFTPEIGFEVHERMTLENLLRGAVARHEIAVNYQPQFELADQRLISFEALARWTHPTLGEIPPAKFIPIAEESGMIWALGSYIMEQACLAAVQWQKRMPYPISVAINASSIQFRRKGFVEEVSAILERTGLKPELLQIEITESAMVGGLPQAAEIIFRLREMGISMAIDDFGTGYSSLSYLPSLAFDVLKIDRSFVKDLNGQPESQSMIRTLIGLAHNFGMQVIVEGVENPEQLAIIKALGANGVQGFLTGRPTASPADFMRLPESL